MKLFKCYVCSEGELGWDVYCISKNIALAIELVNKQYSHSQKFTVLSCTLISTTVFVDKSNG